MSKRVFLCANWENLVMINYRVDPEILKPYIPAGTELDLWDGHALVSMVGFMFTNTRVLGIKWPQHVNFEEVNLRFYVRYFNGTAWKRGAVFISELVPKPIIAIIANNFYNEHYRALPMRSSVMPAGAEQTRYLYQWKINQRWNSLGATVSNNFTSIISGSAEEFIFEHYWGYNLISKVKTMEYEVQHVSWQIAAVKDYTFDADVAALYGEAFVPYLTAEPFSVFFCQGIAHQCANGEQDNSVTSAFGATKSPASFKMQGFFCVTNVPS